LILVDQGNQPITNLQANGVNGHNIVPAQFLLLGLRLMMLDDGDDFGLLFLSLRDNIGRPSRTGRKGDKNEVGHTGNQPDGGQNSRSHY